MAIIQTEQSSFIIPVLLQKIVNTNIYLMLELNNKIEINVFENA